MVLKLFKLCWREHRAIGSVRLLPYTDDIAFLVAIDQFKIIPRTPIIFQASFVSTSQRLGKLVSIDVFYELLLIGATYDLDFLSSLLVQECFDDGPDTCENPWCIYNHHLP